MKAPGATLRNGQMLQFHRVVLVRLGGKECPSALQLQRETHLPLAGFRGLQPATPKSTDAKPSLLKL